MAQKPLSNSRNSTRTAKRPLQDVVTAKQAAQFPGVGMTLPRYQYDPRDQRRRSTSTSTVIKRSFFQRIRKRITLKRTALVVAMLALLVGGWLGGKFIYNAHKLFGGNILSVLSTTKLKGEDSGRVNILLAGNSADDVGHNGANLTDSIMLMSIDSKNNTAFLLSIPRDLWVKVPGDGHQKINGAYVVGEAEEFNEDGYPKGGMGALQKVVSRDLGIDIHYYALVNYKAMQQAVDAVGGINFTVKSEDPRGLYDPNTDYKTKGPLVKLANGRHVLNGQQALNLARARGDAYNSYGFASGDFQRTENQRQMLVALKSKAVSAGVLANPSKLSNLADVLGNNVKTDFNINEVRRLYDLVKKIDGKGIKSLSLNEVDGKSLLASFLSPQGQSALIPAKGLDNFSEIQRFINKQMSTNPVVREGAKIAVLNATDTNGLAVKVQKKLAASNLIVDAVGDAGTSAQTTTIIDVSAGKKPATLAALKKLFGERTTAQNPYAGVYDADFIIVLGADQVTAKASATPSSR